LPVVTEMAGVAAAAVPLSTPDLWLTAVERGVMLAGLAISLGGLAGRGLSRQYKGDRPGPLPGPWAVRGALLGAVACAVLLITAEVGPGLAASLAWPSPEGLHSGGTAEIAGIELILFAAAAVALRLRQSGLGTICLCGVVLAEGIRSHPEGIIAGAGAFVAVCHIFPALMWAGMLVYAIRAALAWRGDPEAARGIVRLYATAAAWLFALVIVTGVISALVVLPLGHLGSALTTTYGSFLIAKVALVAVAAGLAMAGRARLRRAYEPGTGPALVTRLEVGALAAVLAVTGVLTVLTPPAAPVHGSSTTQAPASMQRVHPVRRG
jgi:copper transport protein